MLCVPCDNPSPIPLSKKGSVGSTSPCQSLQSASKSRYIRILGWPEVEIDANLKFEIQEITNFTFSTLESIVKSRA